jgi:type I restriction enzyme, S subunit
MSWKKVKLGDILKRRRETIKINPDEDYKLVTIRTHHKGVTQRCMMKGSEIKSPMSAVRAGDFILSGIDARNGAFGIVPDELDGAIVTNDFWCLDPDDTQIEKGFLLFLTSTDFFDYICKQSSDGMTQRIRLQKDRFYNYEIALPSIDEQKLTLGKLKRLKSDSVILSNELSNQLNILKQLRQQFLQEAVQGVLIKNEKLKEKNTETGAALLKRIKAEKAKAGKKEKSLAPIKTEEIPFEIPDDWVWCRLGEICDNITKGSSPKWQGVNYVEEGKGILYITSKNVDSFKIDLTNSTYVEEKFNEIEPRSILKKGDLLTNIVGASIGRTAIYDLDVLANINQAVCILRIEHHNINKNYLLNLMNSDFALKMMSDSQFAPGRANLSMGNIANFPIPLPPLSIQSKIVEKVNSLMGLCDEIEGSIRASQKQNEGLLQEVLRAALAG